MEGAEAANYMNNLYKNAGPNINWQENLRLTGAKAKESSELTLPFHLNLSLKIQ